MTDTWNASGTTFAGLKLNITNTASAAASLIFDFQIGSASIFRLTKGATLKLLNATTSTGLSVYNTFTDASNYERGVFNFTTTSNVLTIGTQAQGSGSGRNLNLVVGSNVVMVIGAHSGNFNCAGNEVCGYSDTFLDSTNKLGIASNAVLGFSSSTAALGSMDTAVSRSAAGVIAFGNGAVGNGSACIVAKTKAGAPSTSDVPASSWALIRDTSGATTKLYYNNAGTLQSVALA